MTSTAKKLRVVARSMLTHVGDDIRDIDFELIAVRTELEMLTEKMNDAKWAGDLDRVNGVFYQILIKRTMRAILQRRRMAKIKETMK